MTNGQRTSPLEPFSLSGNKVHAKSRKTAHRGREQPNLRRYDMKTKLTIILMCLLMCTLPVSAKTHDTFSGRVKNANGDIFIIKNNKIRVGAFKYRGHLCYGRHKKTAWYPAGSLTNSAYRYIDNTCYLFDKNGYAVTKSTKNVKINPVTWEVYWWYIPGSGHRWRYNTRRHRYEHKVGCKFVEVGMQCYPADIERTY